MSPRPRWTHRLGDPSLIVAVFCTLIYYAIMLQPSMKGSVLARYTTEHAVDYIIVAMFFWGMVDVALKLCSFPRELFALRADWIAQRTGREPVSQAAVLLKSVEERPRWMRESRMGRRLTAALSFVTETGSADEFSDHLRYLADQDDEQTYARYSVDRFVVAVTPILGFLGTVVHFGTALSGLSFSNLDNELSHVVSEMGTAFNTTTVALGAAMTMMFAMFLCERIENGFMARINKYVERELSNRFEVQDAKLIPFLSVLKEANDAAQATLAQSLNRHAEAWSNSLELLFRQFEQRQKDEERRWQQVLTTLQEQHQNWDAGREERLRQILSLADARQDKHMEQIQTALQAATSFSDEVGTLAKTLNGIARGEGRLVELQASLAENLRVLHETHQIDGALHGLTAAIHLMTVRNGGLTLKEAA